MMFKIIAAVLPLAFSASSWAVNFESCPGPRDIQGVNGIYTAPTASGKGEWLGVMSRGPASAISSFESGVFYPSGNQSGKVGTVGYCEYKTQDGVSMNMRYRPGETPDVAVKLRNAKNWKEITTELGLVLYECTNKAPGVCAFSEVEG
ncbi:DUF3757 domain-containing protein [Pseudomonas fluorescens]|uniref:DUF3757 domain-containing protein n=1 Tax=Pseudomonas fluorescens TaxID=294 RepID=A0A5E7BMZ8_PSEFL|nr:DUF3757 domain-containing protein [Pseudomonas fluorescens]VVN93438.1 hypothetical protein PS691_02051 [Pseudomonas fluorescens]